MKYIILHHSGAWGDSHKQVFENLFISKNTSLYDFYIDKSGIIFGNYNSSNSFSICIEGDFNDIRTKISKEQEFSILNIIDTLKILYPHIIITRHDCFNICSCPGKFFTVENIYI